MLLEQALRQFEAEGIQPIVQLDDLDCWAANDHSSYTFLGNLRALVEIHTTMTYLTTSWIPLAELQDERPKIAGSPFFNIFRKFELPFLASA